MSPTLCISDFELQHKHLEKFKSNRVTKNRHGKSKVFCMYGAVALWSLIQTFIHANFPDLVGIFPIL